MLIYTYSQPDDELYHYGVLGMKWGKRKAQYYSSNVKRAKRNSASDNKQARGLEAEARSYASASKKASSRKAKRLDKMASEASKEAKQYRESAKEWDSIGKYQSGKLTKQNAKNSDYKKAYDAQRAKQNISTNRHDISLYGHSGANKIKRMQDEKGYTHAKAEGKYRSGKLAKGYAIAAVAAPVATAIAFYGKSNVRKAAVNSGKKVVDGMMKKRFNMEVLDASGEVIKRYRDKGVRVVADMLTR